MDLSLIRERIMSGALLSLDDMNRDLFVMCNNAMVFNGKGDPYFDYSKVRPLYIVQVAPPFGDEIATFCPVLPPALSACDGNCYLVLFSTH